MSSIQRPSFAFIAVSWAALLAGAIFFLASLWSNGALTFNDKGFYFAVLMLGLFAAISVQKIVRDRIEGVPFTTLYYGLCWTALIVALSLLVEGLVNAANLSTAEKGSYAMAFALALFGAITVQKNTRDMHGTSSATRTGND
jgi:uncharacterized membrane protein YiaA